MAKIGNYEYPEIPVEEALESSKKIEQQFQGNPAGMSAVANALGYANERSGTFLAKLANLRRYGLIEGRGQLKVTEIGKKILFPVAGEDQNEPYTQILEKVPLFKELYSFYGSRVPNSEEFVSALLNITKAERTLIQAESEKIRKLYLALTSRITNKSNVGSQVFGSNPNFSPQQPSGKRMLVITSPFRFESEETTAAIDAVISMLNSRKEELKVKKEKE